MLLALVHWSEELPVGSHELIEQPAGLIHGFIVEYQFYVHRSKLKTAKKCISPGLDAPLYFLAYVVEGAGPADIKLTGESLFVLDTCRMHYAARCA